MREIPSRANRVIGIIVAAPPPQVPHEAEPPPPPAGTPSNESIMPFPLESRDASAAMSHESRMPLPLQSLVASIAVQTSTESSAALLRAMPQPLATRHSYNPASKPAAGLIVSVSPADPEAAPPPASGSPSLNHW